MTNLVLIRRSHSLDDLFTLSLSHTTSLSDNLSENGINFTGHACGVTADVEEGLL